MCVLGESETLPANVPGTVTEDLLAAEKFQTPKSIKHGYVERAGTEAWHKKLRTNGEAFKSTDDRWGGTVWYMDELGGQTQKAPRLTKTNRRQRIQNQPSLKFFSFSKKDFFNRSYSSSVQT